MTYRNKHPESQTFTEAFAQQNELLTKAFAHHAIKQLDRNAWRCAAPSTSNMSFYVARMPGAWAIYGDIGDIFIQRSDTLDWLRGAANSASYLWEKVPASLKVEEFYPGDALARLDDRDMHSAEEAAKIYERWIDESIFDGSLDSYSSYCEAVYDVTGDSEDIVSQRMGMESIRCVLAARWYCERMPVELPVPGWRKQ
jgi:hypothetical protein